MLFRATLLALLTALGIATGAVASVLYHDTDVSWTATVDSILAFVQPESSSPQTFSPPLPESIQEALDTPVTERGQQFRDALGEAALEQIDTDLDVVAPGWEFVFTAPHDQLRGAALPRQKAIFLFISPDTTLEDAVVVLSHEIGHAFDIEHLDAETRDEWLERRGEPDGTYWPESEQPDFATGAGDFAEAFAQYLVPGRTNHSHFTTPLSDEDLDWIGETVEEARVSLPESAVAGPLS